MGLGGERQNQLTGTNTTNQLRAVQAVNRCQRNPLTDIRAIACFIHSLAVQGDDGKVLAWGRNSVGQVGNGAPVPRSRSR